MTTPNGMIDLNPKQTSIRNHIFKVATKCFELYGSVQIDTPVVEMLSTVNNLYGGDFNKQVFMLEDKKDGDSSDPSESAMLLRYDLTVPLCRYVNSLNLKQFKRHQIGKVYRKDHAQVSKGRYREFYQMDFDIVGSSENNIYDIEMIDCLTNVMNKLIGIENVIIKLNHRGIVNSLLEYSGVPNNLVKQVSSILDRLDKMEFKDIYDELTNLIGANSSQVLFTIYENKLGIEELMTTIKVDQNTKDCVTQILSFKPNLVFDPFLIRGMDYYTGIIYEVTYINKEIMPFTICAGGRYDNMIGSFGGQNVPAIGMSLGVERIAKILEKISECENLPQMYDVYVATVCKTSLTTITTEQMLLCSELRSIGLRVLTTHIKEQVFKRHLDNVFNNNIPYMVIIGDKELETDTISIKNISTREQILIKRSELKEYFKNKF